MQSPKEINHTLIFTCKNVRFMYTSHNVVPPKIAFPIQISKAIISEAPLPPNYLRRSHPPFLESGQPWEPTFPSFLGVITIYNPYIIYWGFKTFIFPWVLGSKGNYYMI